MRYPIFTVVLLFLMCSCTNSSKTFLPSEVSMLPKPLKLVVEKQSFVFDKTIDISTGADDQIMAADHLVNLLINTTGYTPELVNNDKASIVFSQVDGLPKEGYQLHIKPKKIIIKASDAGGYFYGVQSLKYLLLQNTIAATEETKWLVPCLSIEDAPRFKWRAYMLDESRYFHGEDFVKLLLDQMALMKMNVFHWHLTDDAGWRIEIKKYPLLTEIGSHRANSEIETWKSGKLSGKSHSGFYTQEQIKEIVAYAADRNITIVPEFEMPGHASAAIAAYTWLGTAGRDIEVPVIFGRHYDNYDITKPEVEQFVKDVLLELFELFPSEVIHIGGDEVGYEVWDNAAHVQKYMKENNIKTSADLQVGFTNKISKFIAENGRRMMGWNEIMGINVHQDFEEKKNDVDAETQLAKNVIVHFWKGNVDLATEAAEKGYGIVNSLHSETYLDYTYESISLEKAYSFDPVPEGLDKRFHKNIYGLGCQMWSEWTPTYQDVAYQTFPRIAAYAEVGWTTIENKDFDTFQAALKKLQYHWDALGINYAKVLDNADN
ncbi:beta-N-acetylhexosaminidase [Muriicola sp. Z0-33]|uniref:beta-N-acetylhexosaminidase n=1 Tax=Muriicola sp. Z0-33 TaxID=2816957 RepID=UPI002A01D7C8|nr:beta-N-acetylhexosaminidase [Muriicola sp. Z0-33]MCW5517048.1 beta-N-acetylhexosaminidase [Muriicola sp. Z0-33]